MLKIYGSMLCPDCVRCLEDLDRAGTAYEYLDFSESLKYLKEFLVHREAEVFADIRAEGRIGIPCILREDGSITFDWEAFM